MAIPKFTAKLDAIRPDQWFNIPAPVIDAFAVLINTIRNSEDKFNRLDIEMK